MPKLKTTLFLFLFSNIGQGQIVNPDNPELKIDFWLKNYTQITQTKQYDLAKEVFDKVLAVADKPLGVLPKLYVFSDLKFGQVFALPDGSIILPLSVIDFCLRDRNQAESRLAFLIGHELKHVVRVDYHWIQRILEFSQPLPAKQYYEQMQRSSISTKWGQSLMLTKSLEIEADTFGIIYASLAGYEIRSIVAPSNTFISDYYSEAGLDIYGDPANNSVAERRKRLNQRLGEAVAKLDLFDFGVRLYAIGKYDAAIELFEKFVTSYPSREVYNNLGMCYYQKAFVHYLSWRREEIASDPKLVFRMSAQIDPFSRLQSTYRTRGPNDKQLFQEAILNAIKNFKEAQNRDANYEITLNNLGCAYLLNGELDFAKGCFKKAVELNLYCKEAHNNLGVAYVIEDNLSEAGTRFLAALSRSTEYLETIYNLGQLNIKTNQLAEAKKHFEKYIQLDESSDYSDSVRKLLGSGIPNDSLPRFTEKIRLKTPSQIFKLSSGRRNQFSTPSADVQIVHDTTQYIHSFQFVYKPANQKIFMVATAKGYKGHTENGVKIGMSDKLIEKKYPYFHTIKGTSTGSFLIYPDLGLVFELRNQKVYGWYLYETS